MELLFSTQPVESSLLLIFGECMKHDKLTACTTLVLSIYTLLAYSKRWVL